MTLSLLENIASHFKQYRQITHLKRIGDNLFKLELDEEIFYLDLQKHKSTIFIAPSISGNKPYQAPFDILLSKLTTRAKILDCHCDGSNRILILHCRQNHPYKTAEFFLHFEFTGRHTNAILIDSRGIILEALRHLNASKSSRIIKPNHPFAPLFQKPRAHTPQALSQEELLEILRENFQTSMAEQITQKKQAILQKLQKKLDKHRDLLESLPAPKTLEESAKLLSHQATLLLAHLQHIPPFATQVELPDFDGKRLNITLPHATRSPQEAINAMFHQSKKLAKKAKSVHLEQNNLQDKIHFLTQEIDFITHTTSLENLNILQSQKAQKKQSQKFECFFIENHKVSIGRNQSENQALLESAKAGDYWLHIRDIPSSHMIIHCGKNKPAQHIIQKAGEILVGLSGIAKGNLEVDYTQRRFVKIKEKANVVYAKHQTLSYKK